VSREDRLHRMQDLLRHGKAVSMEKLMSELQVDRATIRRYRDYLRDTFHFDIQYDRGANGYRLVAAQGPAETGISGIYFSASELHALLAMDLLIQKLEPGILASHIAPLRKKLKSLLGAGEYSTQQIEQRVRILPMTARHVEGKVFELTVGALLSRKRLQFEYLTRGSGVKASRYVSPQRLAHYRDNWYLDGWCHQKRALRMFSLDSMSAVSVVDSNARDVGERDLGSVLEAGYGIFSGRRTKIARLRFSAARSRWVSAESWHPNQRTRWDKSGRFCMDFPYSNHPELLMDVLRHVPDVEVLGPKSLRNLLIEMIKEAAAAYL